MKRILLFLSLIILVACNTVNKVEEESTVNKELLGEWSGNIEIPGSPLLLKLDLKNESGSLSVPIQGLENYPFEKIAYDDNDVTIKIDLEGSQIIIKGSLQGEEITGTFTQDGQAFSIQLERFIEEEVTYKEIEIPVTDGDLSVALETPKSDGPSDVAIILAGSGPTDKDGNTIGSGKNDSLKMLADQLADEGIASIRYDKRGIGDNASLISNEEDLTIEHYVDDVGQIIEYIQSNDEFAEMHIIGHSEGSLIGMLATYGEDVASFVSLAGVGRSMDEVILEQLESQLTEELFDEANSILNELKKGQQVDNVSNELHALFRPSVQPYMISALQYNPAEVIEDVDVRTLIIQGTTDLQVSVEDAKQLKESKETAELVIVEGMNHILKDAPISESENIATYTDPTIPLSTHMVNSLLSFLKKDNE